MASGENRGKRLLDLIRMAVKSLLAATSRKIEERQETEDVMDDSSPELDHFCLVMEQIFVMNIKEVSGFFGGSTPKEWWDYIKTLAKVDRASANTIENVENMNAATPSGKARAWIRISLIEKRLKSNLQKLIVNNKVTSDFYEIGSLFRDPERSQMLLGILELLSVINFTLNLKDFDFDSVTLDQTIASLQVSVTSQSQKYEAMLAEFGEVQELLSNKEAITRQKLEKASGALTGLKKKISEQSEEMERLQSRVEESGVALESAKVKNRELLTQIEKARKKRDLEIRETELELEEVKAQLEAKKAIQSRLTTMVQTHQDTINKLNEELREKKEKISNITSGREEELWNEKVRLLENQVEKITSDSKKEIEEMKSNHEKQILELEKTKELAVATAKSEKDREIIQLLKNRKESENEDNEKKNDELMRIKSEKLILEREILKHDQAQSKFQRNLDLQKSEFEVSLKKKEKEIERISSDFVEAKNENSELKSQMEREEEKRKEQQKRIHSLEMELKQKEIQFQAKEREIESKISSEVSKSLSTTVEELKKKNLQKKEKYNLRLKEINEKSSEKELSLLKKIEESESKLQEIQSQNLEFQTQIKAFEQKEKKNSEIVTKNGQLKEKLKSLSLSLEEREKREEEERAQRERESAEKEKVFEIEKEKLKTELTLIKDELSLQKTSNLEMNEKTNLLEKKKQELERNLRESEEKERGERGKRERLENEVERLGIENKELNEKTKQFRKTIQLKETEENHFKDSLESSKRNIESAEQNSARLQSQLEQREETIVRLSSEKRKLEEMMESLDTKIESGLSQIEEAKKEEIQKKTNRFEQLQSLSLHQERTIEEQKGIITQKETEISFSSQKISELKEKLSEVQEKYENEQNLSREKIEDLLHQKGESGASLKILEDEISQLKRKENDYLETINSLERNKEEKEKEISSLSLKIKKLESEINQAKEELSTENEKYIQLQKSKEEMGNEIGAQKTQINELKQFKLEKEEELKEMNEKMNEKINEKENEISSLLEKNKNLKNEINSKTNEISSLRETISEKDKRIEEREREREKEKEQLKGKFQENKKENESKLETLQISILEKEQEVENEKRKSEQIAKELQKMKEEHKTKEEDLQSQKTSSSLLSEKIKELENEKNDLKNAKENLNDELDLEKRLVVAKENELDQIKRNFEEIQLKHATIVTENRSLSEELEREREERKKEAKEKENLFEKEKNSLLNQIEELKEEQTHFSVVSLKLEEKEKELKKTKEREQKKEEEKEREQREREGEEREREGERKEREEEIESLRKLVSLQKKSLTFGEGNSTNEILELEIKDLKRQMELYKNQNKNEIEKEIQFLLNEWAENAKKLREAREEIGDIETYRLRVTLLLQGSVQEYIQQTPNPIEQWKSISAITGQSLSFLSESEMEEHEKCLKENVGLKHDIEELNEELLALKNVIKEQSVTFSSEKSKLTLLTNSKDVLERETKRLEEQLKKSDEIISRKEEEILRLEQIEEQSKEIQRRSEVKDAALRSLTVKHQELEEVHRRQTDFIEQLKTKIGKNAKTIKQLSVSIHAMGPQLQKAQNAEKEHQEVKKQLRAALLTVDLVAKISPQVALEATSKSGLKGGDPSSRSIHITDQNVSEYISELEIEKKALEEALSDLQLKYVGLTRILSETPQTKEEDVAELDASFNFQMRVEKVRKKERELMQEIHTMSEKESILSEQLQASQLMLRQLKSNLEASTRKTDRLTEKIVDLVEQNRSLARAGGTIIENPLDYDSEEENSSSLSPPSLSHPSLSPSPHSSFSSSSSSSSLPQREEREEERREERKIAMKREWERDEDVSSCPSCLSSFGLIVRKHHCRHCGRIFCDSCSSHQAILPQIHKTQPQRICNNCNQLVKMLASQK